MTRTRCLIPGTLASAAAIFSSTVVLAQTCGGAGNLVALTGLIGPPSIQATESSTDQALELIRRRREAASGPCPSGFVRSGGNCVPAGQQVAAATPPSPSPPAPAATVTTTTTTGPVPQPKQQPSTPGQK